MKLSAREVLGNEGAQYLPLLQQISAEVDGREYVFMPIGDYHALLESNVAEGMRVYWTEMLYRAHWSASATVLRTVRWLEAFLAAANLPNMLGFTACLRGLIEAAADSNHGLINVGVTLAQTRATIQRALEGKLDAIVLSGGLEDVLIHFTHARKLAKEEVAPASHRAKTTRDYLEQLKHVGKGEVANIYSRLCEITHPSAASVALFATEAGDTVTLRRNPDTHYIQAICKTYCNTFSEVLLFGVNPALVTLKVLNYFDHTLVQTAYMDQVSLSEIPGWRKITAAWSKSTLPRDAAADDPETE